jgi:tetratricopeptide (TPR) repeat protein
MRWAIALVLAAGVGAAAGASEGNSSLPVIEYAKAPKLAVEWPGAVNREALVILEFDVLASGKVANIHLVDDGFHEKRFVDAATRALQKSTWQPRRINGKAVDSNQLRKAFRFSISDMEPGITAEFRTEARKVEDLLKKGDFAAGEFHAQSMLAGIVKLNYEYALLEAELAQTYAAMGRVEDAVRKVRRATANSGGYPEFIEVLDEPPANKASNYLLDKKTVVILLDLQMRLLAAQGLRLEALQAYYELAGLGELPAGHSAPAFAARLVAEIRGPTQLRGRIEARDGGWRQFLSRRRFALEKVDGEIRALRLACSGNSMDLSYAPGEEWTVPEGWWPCTVQIATEPGTRLEFVEFPDAPAGAVQAR